MTLNWYAVPLCTGCAQGSKSCSQPGCAMWLVHPAGLPLGMEASVSLTDAERSGVLWRLAERAA